MIIYAFPSLCPFMIFCYFLIRFYNLFNTILIKHSPPHPQHTHRTLPTPKFLPQDIQTQFSPSLSPTTNNHPPNNNNPPSNNHPLPHIHNPPIHTLNQHPTKRPIRMLHSLCTFLSFEAV